MSSINTDVMLGTTMQSATAKSMANQKCVKCVEGKDKSGTTSTRIRRITDVKI
jgi:hypothetical protein